MDRKELERAVADRLSTRGIAKLLGSNQTVVRYWLRKYGLRTDPKREVRFKEEHSCPICTRAVADGKQYCGACRTKIRRIRSKWAATQFLGGACVRCGWIGGIEECAAYEFHHKEDKKFSIGNVANKSWDVIKRELKKCELWCSRCHRIHHSKNGQPELLRAVKNYRGRTLE